MDPLPSNSPHFIGAMIAVAGLLPLLYLGKRLDRRTLVFGLGAPILLAIGLFGNGNGGVAASGIVWTGAELNSGLDFSQTHVDHALDLGLSDEFIAYSGQLTGTTPSFEGTDFDSRLVLEWPKS